MSILIGFVVEVGLLVRDLSPQLIDLAEEPFVRIEVAKQFAVSHGYISPESYWKSNYTHYLFDVNDENNSLRQNS